MNNSPIDSSNPTLMRLTPFDVERLATPKGGHTFAMLDALGVERPPGKYPARGWKRRLIGREIPVEQFEHARLLAATFWSESRAEILGKNYLG